MAATAGPVPRWQQKLLAAKAAKASAADTCDKSVAPVSEVKVSEVATIASKQGGEAVRTPGDVEELPQKSQQDADGTLAATAVAPTAPLKVVMTDPPEVPLRVLELQGGVRVEVFAEGSSQRRPQSSVEATVRGRLTSGVVFESTAAKGQPPMRMALGKGEIIPGMDIGLRALALGSRAVMHIPADLAYGAQGVARMVPPGADLSFEVELLEVDGVRVEDRPPAEIPPAPRLPSPGYLKLPWWLARAHLPPPSEYYLSFCRHLARGSVGGLPGAKWIPRRTLAELRAAGGSWDMSRGGPFVARGVQEGWKAKETWDLNWFRKELGAEQQFVKWIGPVFTKKDTIWGTPVFESSVAEYVDYIRMLEAVDPDCDERNAANCPRLYLNGWPLFERMPKYRDHLQLPKCVDDVTYDLRTEVALVREALLASFTRSAPQLPQGGDAFQKGIDDEYWGLTKLFVSPKGAITRLHFDNGGAHAWLTQLRGRKLFVCFPPEDTEHLHAFEGDEGLQSGSFIDPLAEDAYTRWPNYKKATPHVAIVEEGETIFNPQGWWHYAVSLDTSITIMRNFYSAANAHESVSRDQKQLSEAMLSVLKRNEARTKGSAARPESILRELAEKHVSKMWEAGRRVRAQSDGRS